MAIRNGARPLRDPGLRNILDDLRKRMMDGRLPAASRLPSVRELASTYGVATTTIHRCLQELAGVLHLDPRVEWNQGGRPPTPSLPLCHDAS